MVRGQRPAAIPAPLTDDEKAEYLKRYEAAVAKVFPAMSDGTVLLPFPRVFIVATR
jgi:trans-aconitate 2-methyltransferase